MIFDAFLDSIYQGFPLDQVSGVKPLCLSPDHCQYVFVLGSRSLRNVLICGLQGFDIGTSDVHGGWAPQAPHISKEADEVMQGTSGRWYPFVVSTETLLCLEKQGLPEHLQQLPSIESPVAVSSLLAEMEDSGEASGICEKGFYCGPPF